MNVEKFTMDRSQARELFKEYRKHQNYSAPIDREIQRVYQLIAQGRMMIQALASIKAAGLNTQEFPKLAIVRADAKECWFQNSRDGSAVFSMANAWNADHHHRRRIAMPAGTFAFTRERWHSQVGRAIVPLIPVHLRPKRAMANYHILWEAEWTCVVPRDPMLLRRIGKGDMWLVLAAWDLTEVERVALASRLSA